MRAVQITRFGGPEVLDVVDLPDPEPSEGREVFDISTAGVSFGASGGLPWSRPWRVGATRLHEVAGARCRVLAVADRRPSANPGLPEWEPDASGPPAA
jgi:hypothetical protein